MYVFVYHEYSFLFIASFAFVLQMLRAKPIPLRLHYPKAPSGRELPTESGEGECVTIESTQAESHADSFPRYRGPPSSRRKAMLPPDSMEKEYGQNARTPLAFFRSVKTCFMEGTPFGPLLLFHRKHSI